MDHSVLFKQNELNLSILIGIKSVTLLHIFLPISLVFRAISIIKHPVTIPYPIHPGALIPVPYVLAFAFGFKPYMHSPSFLMVILPFSDIFFTNICPVHCPFALLFVVFPFPFKVISRRVVVHLSITLFEVVSK